MLNELIALLAGQTVALMLKAGTVEEFLPATTTLSANRLQEIDLTEVDLEGIRTMFEERWLGESIPALNGLTPQQAAADPTMRPELVALLDDFEWQERRQPPESIGMRSAKLRESLGL